TTRVASSASSARSAGARTPAARATARSTRSSSPARTRSPSRRAASAPPPREERALPRVAVAPIHPLNTPLQYPGQTEPEPFSRVHVWLDGTDVILGYQPLVDVPNADARVGMRVARRSG